jgi:shikimate kinase
LGRPFVDLDRVVEGKAGATIAALFKEQGEDCFRALEAEALSETLELLPRAVVATGGGVVLRVENRDRLAESFVVYLSATPAVVAARVAADPRTAETRPALAAGGLLEEAEALYASRDALYREVADAVIDAEVALDDVVKAVVAAVSPEGLPG